MISFNTPYPANYGGVIGVFYHLKALHLLGAKVILHCFEYGRPQAKELEAFCEEVHYYPRKMGLIHQLSSIPFIVKSRTSAKLNNRLAKDNYPIIFEGTHVCATIDHQQFKDRIKLVRMHNIEWKYYHNLAIQENNFAKRMFFHLESWKLKRFELSTIIKNADHLLAVSPDETKYFKQLNHPSVHYLSAFHANEQVTSKPGKGDYVIYHGDLSVKDNENAALFLTQKVFAHINTKLVIAGLNPGLNLINTINNYPNVELIPNVPSGKMEDLIQNAHVNLLISFNAAGMKLKLLNAVYRGRFCMVNDPMVINTGMEKICVIKNSADEMKEAVLSIMNKVFDQPEIEKRRELLSKSFSNVTNAKITMQLLG